MTNIEILKNELGVELLLEELILALTNQELNENIEYIARNWSIQITKK